MGPHSIFNYQSLRVKILCASLCLSIVLTPLARPANAESGDIESEVSGIQYRKSDLDSILQRSLKVSQVYEELLKRSALDQLIDMAYLTALLSDQKPGTTALFRGFGIPESRFPGLAAKLNTYRHQVIERLNTADEKSSVEDTIAESLVTTTLIVTGLEKKQTDLLTKLKGIQNKESDASKQTISKIHEEIVQSQSQINQVLSLDPLHILLTLDASGPKNMNASDNPRLRFELASPAKSLSTLLFNKFESEASGDELKQLALASLKKWIPALEALIYRERIDIELRSARDLAQHGFLRDATLIATTGHPIGTYLEAYDLKMANQWGFVNEMSSKALNLASIASVIFSAPLGIGLGMYNSASSSLDLAYAQTESLVGALLGWNDHETMRLFNSQNEYEPLIWGASQAITLGLIGGYAQQIAVAAKGGATARALLSDLITFEKSKRTFILMGMNVTSSQMANALSSMKQRNKSFGQLLGDSNWTRDAVSAAVIDALLAFYGGSKNYLCAAMVLGGAAALASVIGQQKATHQIDWQRVEFDFAFIATISFVKYRFIFGPMVKKTWTTGLRTAAANASPLARAGALYGMFGIVFGTLFASNTTGTYPYTFLSRKVEVGDLKLEELKNIFNSAKQLRDAR